MTKKFLKQLAIFILVLAVTIPVAQAASFIPDEFRPINEPFNITEVIEDEGNATAPAIIVLQIIAGGLLFFAAPVAVIMIIIAAFRMTAGGANSEQVDQAKNSLIWSVAGLATIMLSYSIVRAIIAFVITAAESTPLGSS